MMLFSKVQKIVLLQFYNDSDEIVFHVDQCTLLYVCLSWKRNSSSVGFSGIFSPLFSAC